MRYKPYPSYKPSGVEWLGDVPGHWRFGRISGLFRFRSGGTPSTGDARYWDGDIPWVSAKDMKVLRIVDTEDHITAEAIFESAATMVPEGAVLLVTRSGILKHTLPVAVALRPVAINQDIKGLVVVAGQINPLYFAYWVQGNQGTLLTLWRQQGATVESVNFESLKASPVPLPPIRDQALIAEFLDTRTAKLDTLVTKKRALIEKLKEKRTALISRAVTRGLPPDAARAAGLDPHRKLKPSGIDWLGDVPEHWKAGNLRRFARMRTGHTPSRNESEYWENCDIPWFTLADVWQLRDGRQKYLGETKEKISQLGLANSAAELLPAGTVALSRTASVGFSGIMPVPMATTQDFWNWIPDPSLLSEYLLYLFRAMRQEFERLTMGSTHKTIYQPDAARLSICVPPRKEQRTVIDYLDRETAKIDQMIGKVEAAIERLQEYRTALITAAVTGKIDVRGMAHEPN